MSDIITIRLGRNRTKEQAFKDAAITNGWTETIESSEEKQRTFLKGDAWTTPKDAVKGIEGDDNFKVTRITDNGQSVDVEWVATKTIPNPVSIIDFGAAVWAKLIDEKDLSVEVRAAEMRLERRVKGGDKTIVE